jgi:UDP-N-acetylglucosamine 1-carboxyvinyltransferase
MQKMNESCVVINGGKVLNGEVKLSGAKNAALPMLAAACLGKEKTVLENVPVELIDVKMMIQLLKDMGASVEITGTTVECARNNFTGNYVPEDAHRIRTSLLTLGMVAGLQGEIFIPQPGGCKIGERKHDLHLLGLSALGAKTEDREDGIYLKSSGLTGAAIDFYLPTTTGTENIIIAAVLAEGKTKIRNANTRPEVIQLGRLLELMGAEINMQSRIVEINGVRDLKGGAHCSVMSGWDEATTYIIAAGMTQGEIVIKNFNLNFIKEDARYLRETGMELFEWQQDLYISGKKPKQPIDLFTAPYPGVNSDLQPIFAALSLTIPGTSTITDLRFTDRFQYVDEIKKFGADIDCFGNTAIIRGGNQLNGADVIAKDLRGGMACVLTGLVANGTTKIKNVYQIDRGYEKFTEKLCRLGADIKKIEWQL